MPLLRPLSASEQAAAHLRAEMERGHWSGMMPGVNKLATELGVNRKTVQAALRQLEHEGLLVGRGQGRKRLIARKRLKAIRPLRVAILLYEPDDHLLEYIVELRHALVEAGHSAIIATKSLTELKMELPRIGRLVRQTAADAWVVMAGSREVLEWFCTRPTPAFALFGHREGLPLAAAGPDKVPAMVAVTRHLIGLGHRRVILLARQDRRLPVPGRSERTFLDEMTAHGIPMGEYNLPDWNETRDGFQDLLSSLFRITPPTTLIVAEAQLFIATMQFLAGRCIRVPQEVSLICMDGNPNFSWCMPSVSHIRWESVPLIRRIVRWAANVSRGKRDVKQTSLPAEFVEGGMTGPAPAV